MKYCDGTGNDEYRANESGNVVFFVLLSVVLIGLVTVAIGSGGIGGANIDRESLSIKSTQVKETANDYARAVNLILRNGASEVDLRFAHPDASADYGTISTTPEIQVFHVDGGGATYREPPSGINDGSLWEFYGHTHIPEVGTESRAELLAVLPNVTEEFCAKINDLNGYGSITSMEDDVGDCLNAGAAQRFDAGQQFSSGVDLDTVDEATFTTLPALQGCVDCDPGGVGEYHVYHVLLAR